MWTQAIVYSHLISSISCLSWCASSTVLSDVCFVSSLLWQRGDRGERARRRCIYCAKWLRGDKRQFDGVAHHDQRLQNSLGLQGHRCHPLLSLCEARQEGQGGGEGYLSTYFCHAICHQHHDEKPAAMSICTPFTKTFCFIFQSYVFIFPLCMF